MLEVDNHFCVCCLNFMMSGIVKKINSFGGKIFYFKMYKIQQIEAV